jgi:peptidoglycan/LPS O-acetylase OafA/YrhL
MNELLPRVVAAEGRRYYRPELDLLRFLAFFMVFLSHVVPGDEVFFAQAHVPASIAYWIIGMAAGGAFGVDLFFVLSSFLITTLLLRERHAYGTVDVSSFYVRRILRIWPLYFAFLLGLVPLVHRFVPDDSMPAPYILAFSLLAGNWACVRWGYPHSVAGPLWSVSIEEQFYCSWPLIVRRWPDQIVVIACAMLAIAVITRFWLVAGGAVHPQIWCNTLARLDPIACGAVLAVCARRKRLQISPWMRATLMLAGTVVLTTAGRFGDFVGVNALITFPAVAAACSALLLSVLGLRLPSGRAPIIRAFTYLGRISYGLYIFHLMFVTILGVASAHAPIERTARIAAALLATIATAAASHHFFEQPFLRLKQRFALIESGRLP